MQEIRLSMDNRFVSNGTFANKQLCRLGASKCTSFKLFDYSGSRYTVSESSKVQVALEGAGADNYDLLA